MADIPGNLALPEHITQAIDNLIRDAANGSLAVFTISVHMDPQIRSKEAFHGPSGRTNAEGYKEGHMGVHISCQMDREYFSQDWGKMEGVYMAEKAIGLMMAELVRQNMKRLSLVGREMFVGTLERVLAEDEREHDHEEGDDE